VSILDDTLELARAGADAATRAAEEAKKGRQVFDTFSDLVGGSAPAAPAPAAPTMSADAPGLVEKPLTRYVGLGIGALALAIIAVLALRE
jgi:hypothetical protein